MPKIKSTTTPQPIARIPKLGTLKKYGLTPEAWLEMYKRQKGVCPVCQKPFEDRPIVVDHEHVKGFKARKRRKGKKVKDGKRVEVRIRVMSPEERSIHVRGILHNYCNRFVRSWLTIERATSILLYLQEHEKRKSTKSVLFE